MGEEVDKKKRKRSEERSDQRSEEKEMKALDRKARIRASRTATR